MLLFQLFSALALALPQSDNPAAGDPSTPPKSISFPFQAPNPYPSGSVLPTQPDECDGQKPSQDCFNALAKKGYLWFDNKSGCDDTKKSQLETAVWDATTLLSYASTFPNGFQGTRGQSSGIFYMGPDWQSQQSRVSGNLQRASSFKTADNNEYITVSCTDSKNWCGKKIDGKAVGGYAWSYHGWFGYYYHYITLCDVFFGLDTLESKIGDVERELASGSTRSASDMTWLRTTGQFFLHEMMHTRLADGGKEPSIVDEWVDPDSVGPKAYGPRLVNKLAKRPLNQGGGATRSSTNADSYAMLANCLYWWGTTGYFPGLSPKANDVDDLDDGNFPISLYVDLDDNADPSTADWNGLYNAQLAGFGNDAPGSDPAPDPQTTSSAQLPHPTTAPIAPPPPPPPSPPPPASDTCGVWYKVFFDHFEVYGKDFDPAKLGQDGSGLRDNINGCGDLTNWSFEPLTNDANGYQWFAQGNLPIGTKSCVGSAVVSAGGGSADGCTGAG